MFESNEPEYFLACVLCDMIIENSDPDEKISIKNHLRKEHVSAFAMGSFVKELEVTNATETCLSCDQVIDIAGQLRSDVKEKNPFLEQLEHVLEQKHPSKHPNFREIGNVLPLDYCDTGRTSLCTIVEDDEFSESADRGDDLIPQQDAVSCHSSLSPIDLTEFDNGDDYRKSPTQEETSSHSSPGSTENVEFSDSFLTDDLGDNWKIEQLDAISQERLSSPSEEAMDIETKIEMERPRKRKYVFEDVYVRGCDSIPQRLEKARPQLSEALEEEEAKASVVNESTTEEPPVEWRPNREIPLLTEHFASMNVASGNSDVNPQNFGVKLSQQQDTINMHFLRSRQNTESLKSIVCQVGEMNLSNSSQDCQMSIDQDSTKEEGLEIDHQGVGSPPSKLRKQN